MIFGLPTTVAAFLILVAMMGRPAPTFTAAANCRMSVWIETDNPDVVYGTACIGSCADQGDTCEKKVVTQGATTYHYCKCTQAGTPTEPDSTACTTVVTFAGGVWDHYCYNQACTETCVSFTVRWEHTTPCLCQ